MTALATAEEARRRNAGDEVEEPKDRAEAEAATTMEAKERVHRPRELAKDLPRAAPMRNGQTAASAEDARAPRPQSTAIGAGAGPSP